MPSACVGVAAAATAACQLAYQSTGCADADARAQRDARPADAGRSSAQPQQWRLGPPRWRAGPPPGPGCAAGQLTPTPAACHTCACVPIKGQPCQSTRRSRAAPAPRRCWLPVCVCETDLGSGASSYCRASRPPPLLPPPLAPPPAAPPEAPLPPPLPRPITPRSQFMQGKGGCAEMDWMSHARVAHNSSSTDGGGRRRGRGSSCCSRPTHADTRRRGRAAHSKQRGRPCRRRCWRCPATPHSRGQGLVVT